MSFRRRVATTVAAVVVLVVLAGVLDHTRRDADLTAESSLTLTAQTRRLVGHVHQRLRVTAFFDAQDPQRISAATLLLRYQRLNRHIRVRLLEPSAAPAEAQRLGVDPLVGGLALTMGNRTEDADTATEQDITAAIARLLRGRPRSLCVTSGHGESATGDSTDHGLSTAAGLLAQNGYRLRTIDLLVQPDVPAGCDAVLVAAPTAPLGTGASDALASYLARGGRAVVLADPVSAVDLNPLLRPYGLGIRRGIVQSSQDTRVKIGQTANRAGAAGRESSGQMRFEAYEDVELRKAPEQRLLVL